MVRTQWQSSTAGRHLRGRRKTNTFPEILLRKAIHSLGSRFRLHRTITKGCTPDLVIPKLRIAVFVDGDYWHSCPVHQSKKKFRGPNAELWYEKMRRNRERDERSTRLAEAAGWKVIRVWECTIRHDALSAAREVLAGRTPPPHGGVSHIVGSD